jgi:hypothetical protein
MAVFWMYPTLYPIYIPPASHLHPTMTSTTKQITIRIPLPIMEAIARRCDQTGQDRTAVIVEALSAGLGIDPSRDRMDALEARVTALESKVIESQTESRNVTRRVSRTESQTEPRVTHPESHDEPQDSHHVSQTEPRESHNASHNASRVSQSESRSTTLSYSSVRRRAIDAEMDIEEWAKQNGYQKQGKGNKAVWIKMRS